MFSPTNYIKEVLSRHFISLLESETAKQLFHSSEKEPLQPLEAGNNLMFSFFLVLDWQVNVKSERVQMINELVNTGMCACLPHRGRFAFARAERQYSVWVMLPLPRLSAPGVMTLHYQGRHLVQEGPASDAEAWIWTEACDLGFKRAQGRKIQSERFTSGTFSSLKDDARLVRVMILGGGGGDLISVIVTAVNREAEMRLKNGLTKTKTKAIRRLQKDLAVWKQIFLHLLYHCCGIYDVMERTK